MMFSTNTCFNYFATLFQTYSDMTQKSLMLKQLASVVFNCAVNSPSALL